MAQKSFWPWWGVGWGLSLWCSKEEYFVGCSSGRHRGEMEVSVPAIPHCWQTSFNLPQYPLLLSWLPSCTDPLVFPKAVQWHRCLWGLSSSSRTVVPPSVRFTHVQLCWTSGKWRKKFLSEGAVCFILVHILWDFSCSSWLSSDRPWQVQLGGSRARLEESFRSLGSGSAQHCPWCR